MNYFKEEKTLKRKGLSVLFSLLMLAVTAFLFWYVPSISSKRFKLSDLELSLETSYGRERKQQKEYDEVVEDLPKYQEELAAVKPDADKASEEIAALKAQRKTLRAEKKALEEELATLSAAKEETHE